MLTIKSYLQLIRLKKLFIQNTIYHFLSSRTNKYQESDELWLVSVY